MILLCFYLGLACNAVWFWIYFLWEPTIEFHDYYWNHFIYKYSSIFSVHPDLS